MSFPARYPGRCSECLERIYEGDHIEMTDRGAVHADCDHAAPPPERTQAACPVCFLTHPEGKCDR